MKSYLSSLRIRWATLLTLAIALTGYALRAAESAQAGNPFYAMDTASRETLGQSWNRPSRNGSAFTSSRGCCAADEAARLPRDEPPGLAPASCLDQVVLIGEGSLRRVISELMAHYHKERNHPSLGNSIIQPEMPELQAAGQIRCRERLGGVFRYDDRDAA